ncbi:MAG: DUF5053 domain-containing protein [Tannerellaceae bacterium]|nr:DUF5053 domain-containing protein [Tannerellaceae bacterium]
MNSLEKDLQRLKKHIGSLDEKDIQSFNEQLASIKEKYTSPEDVEKVKQFISAGLDEVMSRMGQIDEQLKIIEELKTVSEIISMSYIAKTYFNKSKSWFSQRINGNTIHGKVVRFTTDELETLRYAIKDISNKLGSLSLS